MLAPIRKRERPRVWARSPKIGPDDAEVFTGRPPTNLKVWPLLLALSGIEPAALPTALVRKSITAALLEAAAGRKCSP